MQNNTGFKTSHNSDTFQQILMKLTLQKCYKLFFGGVPWNNFHKIFSFCGKDIETKRSKTSVTRHKTFLISTAQNNQMQLALDKTVQLKPKSF
jgi:hypothetical protein